VIIIKELEELAIRVKDGEEEESAELAERIIVTLEPHKIIQTLTATMRELGILFEKREIFVPELLLASDALLAVMKVVEPHLQQNRDQVRTVILGTVAGDLHEIGKNIVSVVLKAEGFNVIDLGTNVGAHEFVSAAVKNRASIVGLSTLMTTTMHVQREVIERLVAEKIRERFKVIVGGAPVSQKWADQIGADAYCEDAFKGAAYINSLP
jgi:methylmalonyl-CoA mutase cobalamin-binding domain/chain